MYNTSTNDLSSLQIIFWNAKSIRAGRNELEEYVTSENIDVVLVSETWLQPQHSNPNIQGYTMYRTDRTTTQGGGTAIYVRNVIKHYVTALPTLQHLEATAIVVTTKNGPLRLFSCYNTSNHRYPLLEEDLRAIFTGSIPTIAAGDFNAKSPEWNSRARNKNGRTLEKFTGNHPDVTVHAADEPTYYNDSTGLPDTLDIALVKNVNKEIFLQTVKEMSTDHDPVYMQVSASANEVPVKTQGKINWEKFTSLVDEKICAKFPRTGLADAVPNDTGPMDLPTTPTSAYSEDIQPIPLFFFENTAELNRAVEDFEEILRSSIEAATKFPKNQLPTRRTIPLRIVKLIREKNRARRIARQTGLQSDRTEANRMRWEVRKELSSFRSEQWQKKLQGLNTEDNSIWRMTKALKSERQRFPPIHGSSGRIVYTDEEKAEEFADSLQLQCRTNLEDADDDHMDLVERQVRKIARTIPADDDRIEPATHPEIQSVISALKIKKAPGPDGISNKMLKKLPDSATEFLTAMCNEVLRLRHFPRRWKTANVIFIHKPGKEKIFPQNYRPISLLSNIGKIVEKIIFFRLSLFSKENHILPDEQFGFRPEHSTVDQLLRVVEYASTGFEWNQVTGAVFLDISKAFDTVWHDGLVFKLREASVPISMCQLIHSFLRNRNFHAKISTATSSLYDLEAGVPQGSVLSPLLYAIYTADIPKSIRTSLAVYADDTAILARSRQPYLATKYLQELVDLLEEWCCKWLIKVNPEKSAAILLTRRLVKPHGHVHMFGQDIPWQPQVKYLGVILDSRLKFTQHLNYTIQKGKMVSAKLHSLLCRSSKMSPLNKFAIYRSIIRPAIAYAAPCWVHALSKTQLNRLEIFQRKFIRTAFNAPWFVRNAQLLREANLPLLKQFLYEIRIKSLGRAMVHPNRLVRQAVDYDVSHARYKRPKLALTEGPPQDHH